MPQRNMEGSRSQWQQALRPPWISREAGGQSPTSSGAESDTESSSTESEKVNDRDEATAKNNEPQVLLLLLNFHISFYFVIFLPAMR